MLSILYTWVLMDFNPLIWDRSKTRPFGSVSFAVGPSNEEILCFAFPLLPVVTSWDPPSMGLFDFIWFLAKKILRWFGRKVENLGLTGTDSWNVGTLLWLSKSQTHITRNYPQIWRPNWGMRWLALYIVGGVCEQNIIVKKCPCMIGRSVLVVKYSTFPFYDTARVYETVKIWKWI